MGSGDKFCSQKLHITSDMNMASFENWQFCMDKLEHDLQQQVQQLLSFCDSLISVEKPSYLILNCLLFFINK